MSLLANPPPDAVLAVALAPLVEGVVEGPSFEETWAALNWIPQPRQQRATKALRDEGVYALVYGGAAGGGKSAWLRNYLIAFCRRYPGVRVALLRRTYPELRDTHEIPIQMLPPPWGVYVRTDKMWRCANGSILQLAYLEHDADAFRFQGAEFEIVAFDEATHFTKFQLTYLVSRIRSSLVGVPKHLLMATNPGGLGHGFVKDTFITPAPAESVFMARVEKESFPAIFIPARVTDNTALMAASPEYLDRLNALPESLRKALRDGDWSIFAGQYFSEWRVDRHVVDPFPVPAHWRRWGALDWGYTAPLAFLQFAQDPDTGRIYVVRELYQTGMRDSEAAQRILAASGGEQLDAIYADPSMWQKKGHDNALSTAEAYGAAGLTLQPANNDRLSGWRRVRDVLADGKDALPMLQVFANCTNTLRTVPELVHDPVKPEDVDTDGEDHAGDALRYGVVARISVQREQPKAAPQQSAWMMRGGPANGMASVRAALRSRR